RGQEDVNLDPVDPSAIPSLAELIERGAIKRRKAILDLKCRLLEVTLFLCLILCLYFCFTGGDGNAMVAARVKQRLTLLMSESRRFSEARRTKLAFVPPTGVSRRRRLELLDEGEGGDGSLHEAAEESPLDDEPEMNGREDVEDFYMSTSPSSTSISNE
ncbi:unnamed protein product, partial [Amoebophrya sp. A25]